MVVNEELKQNYRYRDIWTMSFPILVSLVMEHLISLTDTAFMGRVGEVELGASAIGGVYCMALFMIGFGFSIGSQIMIARRNGGGEFNRIGEIFRQGTMFLVLIALIMFFISKTFSPMVLEKVISSPGILKATIEYIDMRIYGFFFAFIAIMFRAFYVGTTKTSILTLNSLVLVMSNVVLNYILVFGKFGFPAMGIAGAAIGSSIAEFISALFFVIYTLVKVDHRKYNLFRIEKFNIPVLKGVLDISVWTMLQYFISISVWFMFFVAIENQGERPLAISNIIRSISSFVYMVMNAFAATASALTGNLMGAGRSNDVMLVCRKIVRLCYIVMLPMLAFMALFPSLVLNIYTDNRELIEVSLPSMFVMLSVHLVNVPAVILFNTVSGTGNTRSALGIEVVVLSIYAMYMYFVIVVLRSDVAVCWTAEYAYGLPMLIMSYIYLKRANWQGKTI